MSSSTGMPQDLPSPSQGQALRNPRVLLLLGTALLSATLGAFGIGTKFSKPPGSNAAATRLAAGSLGLLHARLEQQVLMATLLSSGNAEISALTAEVTKLEAGLREIVTKMNKEKTELERLTEQNKNSESRRQALLAERPRLEKIKKTFEEALAKKIAADAAIKAAMGTAGMTLTTADLTAWQADWDRESREAVNKIKEARDSLTGLRAKEDQWIKGKDTLSPDQQKQLQKELLTLHAETTATVKTARDAAAAAEQKLTALITSQRQQLEKATAAAPPP